MRVDQATDFGTVHPQHRSIDEKVPRNTPRTGIAWADESLPDDAGQRWELVIDESRQTIRPERIRGREVHFRVDGAARFLR